MKRFFTVVLAAGLWVWEAHGIVRYVNKTGSCVGGSPCFSTVQAAINASTAAGDVVEVEGNFRYFEAVTVTARTNLTLRARAGDSPAIVATNANGLTVANSPRFTLDGVNVHSERSAFVVTGPANGCDGLTVRNCLLGPSNADGAIVNGDNAVLGVSVANTLFENVEFRNAGNTTGYRASAGTAKFVNNTVRRCRFTANRRHMVLANQHNFILEDCVFFRHTDTQLDPALRPAIEISGSVFTDPVPPGITIRRNLIFAHHGAAIRVGVVPPAAQNVVIEHNTIVSNAEPDGRDGIVFRGGSTGVVRNNVIVSDGRWAALATDASTPGLLQSHNLIANPGTLTSVPGTFAITPTSTPPLGPGSIVDSSAGFVDELGGDFRLGCASQGVGASTAGTNLGYTNALSLAECAGCAGRDSDGDGVNDCLDRCPFTPACADVDSVGCPATTNLFSFGSVWQYDDRGLDLDHPAHGNTGWRASGLNTGTFGAGQLGFGEGDEATVLTRNAANRTYYFSRQFVVPNPAAFGELRLELLYDDGYVVYLNGAEIARSVNMPVGPITFDSLAVYDGENWIDRGVFISPAALQAGTNVVVVELHQETVTSGDLSFDAQLLAVPCRANRPPVARCRDVTLPADEHCLANVSVDDGSFDPDGDPVTVIASPPPPYPLGTNSVTLTVTDPHGAQSQCTATVVVRDSTPPALSDCPGELNVGCAGVDGATATFGLPSARDDCDAAPVVQCAPPSGSVLPVGTNLVSCTATDASGNSSSCSFRVIVAGPAVVFLPPIHTAAENLVRVGQTFPVKVKVDCSGANLPGLAPEIRLAQGDFLATDPAFSQEITQESTSAADTTGIMRAADGFYIYNLSTSGLARDSLYTILVRVRNTQGNTVALGKALIRTKAK